MAREVLAIGNTGEELVSKFNGNFIQTFTDNNAYFYNVESYGAVHDGVTDDTEAIQAAINACVAGGGGTVFFPVGIYIIAGALQNGIEFLDPYTEETKTVNYNSQLYIPASHPRARKPVVKLLGESGSRFGLNNIGTILKSTIAGSGTWPSVICSRSWLEIYGYVNYTDVIMENIIVQVNPFLDGDGISMCGINFLYASHGILNNVCVMPYIVGTYSDHLDSLVQPTSHVFGIGLGMGADDQGQIQGQASVYLGFYYGFVLGEGINANSVHSYFNYIGLTQLKSVWGSRISQYLSHWSTYDIASQQETIYLGAGKAPLQIDHAIIENWKEGRGPIWLDKEAYILDNNDYLYGYMDYCLGQGVSPFTKTQGGTNFLIRDIYNGTNYYWTTDTRPSNPGCGCTGFNRTTSKLEVYNGTTWVDLH